MHPLTAIAAASLCALLAGGVSPAQAQRLVAASSSAPQSNDHVVLGVGLAHVPVYQGADRYRTLPIPVIDVVRGRVFANLQNGLGVNVVDQGPITIGASVTPVTGYRTRDVPSGVDRLKFGAGGRLFLNARLAGMTATIGATKAFAGGTGGAIVDASLSRPFIVSPRLALIPSISATWADRRHNDRYFGIDGKEALTSGLPVYRPGSGFKDANAGLLANYRLSQRISLTASGTVSTLLPDVRRSPLVRRRTQPSFFVSTTVGL